MERLSNSNVFFMSASVGCVKNDCKTPLNTGDIIALVGFSASAACFYKLPRIFNNKKKCRECIKIGIAVIHSS